MCHNIYGNNCNNDQWSLTPTINIKAYQLHINKLIHTPRYHTSEPSNLD